MENLETVYPFVLAPWEQRPVTTVNETVASQIERRWAVRVAVSSSARNGIIGVGGVVRIPLSTRGRP